MKNNSFSQNSTIAELNKFLEALDELGLLGSARFDVASIVEHPEKYVREYELVELMNYYMEEFGQFDVPSGLQQKVSQAIQSNTTADELDDLILYDIDDTRLEGVAKKYQSKAGGLNDKGRAHYNKKGHNLKKPVSKGQAKKSKKSAGRRKSFCSRMGGQKKMHNIDCRADPDKAICKSLKRWDCNEAFDKALDGALGLAEGAGGHEYRNLTSNSFEKRLEKANNLAGSNSGRPSYNQLNKNRQDLIKQAETKRPLKRSEFISLYGYEDWIQYCLDNDIPENSKYTLPDAK